jgi:hypothetical protein
MLIDAIAIIGVLVARMSVSSSLLAATMNQKSSLRDNPKSVSWMLKGNRQRACGLVLWQQTLRPRDDVENSGWQPFGATTVPSRTPLQLPTGLLNDHLSIRLSCLYPDRSTESFSMNERYNTIV